MDKQKLFEILGQCVFKDDSGRKFGLFCINEEECSIDNFHTVICLTEVERYECE